MSKGKKGRTALVVGVVVVLAIAGAVIGLLVTSAKTTPTVQNVTVGTKVPTYVQAESARWDVSTPSACTYTNGQWKWSGTVSDSKTYARSYQIVVDFALVHGATVQDTKVVTIHKARPDHVVHWTVTGAKGDKNLFCVIRFVLATKVN